MLQWIQQKIKMPIFTASIIFDLVGIVTALLVITVSYFKWKLTYWDKIGLPTLNPIFLFGDGKKMLTGKATFGEQIVEFYKAFKARGERHGGVYLGTAPFYIPVDPEIVKHIIQVDFAHFVNHGAYMDEKNDPLNAHLFNLEDSKWRNMRIKLTPTFTSGKMKMMFQTLADCTVGLKTVMDDSVKNKTRVDIKDVLARFTTDIIGSVAFGIECNSLKDPEASFRKYGRRVFEGEASDKFKALLQFLLPPRVLKAIKFKLTKPDVEEFFMKAVRDTVNYREKNNIYRKDFMHLLIQLKNRGSVTDDGKITDEGKTQEKALTMNELTAQAFVFFIAGFETSSTTMTFALLELATNPEIQEKLRNEINTVLAKYDDQLTYSAMMEMTYMEKVINETLRKFPPVAMLFRKCNKDYTVPNTNIQLKKGVGVLIPALALHKDPDYYPDPEKFDPERFSEENKHTRPAFTWIPFGEGPRICIGMRFGMLQTKVGLTTLLKNYKIRLNPKTKVPITLDKKSFITSVEGGVWIDVEKII